MPMINLHKMINFAVYNQFLMTNYNLRSYLFIAIIIFISSCTAEYISDGRKVCFDQEV